MTYKPTSLDWVIMCVTVGTLAWFAFGGREEIKARETPKEYVVCVLDEDKNPTDCVPYGDFVSEHRPQPDPSGL